MRRPKLVRSVPFAAFAIALATVPARSDSGADGLPVASSVPEPTGDAPPIERFREVAAQGLGAPLASVQLGRVEGPIRLAESGLELFVASGLGVDGAKALVALDRDGRSYDLRTSIAIEAERVRARRGKLDEPLFERVRSQPAATHDVVVWLRAPEVEELRQAYGEIVEAFDREGRATRELVDFHHAELARAVAERIGAVTEAAAARFAAAGFEVVGADRSAPIVTLRSSTGGLGALQSDDEVQSLHLAGGGYEPRLDLARRVVRADLVPTAGGGVDGSGVTVAVVEPGRICTANPYLDVAATRDVSGAVSSHTTAVASCVSSTHPVVTGMAPGARLLSANGAGAQTNSTTAAQFQGSIDAVSWSIGRGASILNLSYGAQDPGPTLSAFDRYLDHVVRNNARIITLACGNSGNRGGYAGDPGGGFNAIAVGNFYDGQTYGWNDDAMASSSSWRNPETGVETPQLVAPGTLIRMGSCTSPWDGYTDSGTSFSAPMVAGVAALVVDEYPALALWPEAVRAVLMATAWNNIEAGSALSARDGAGGVDAMAAFRVAGRGVDSCRYGTLTVGSFDSSSFYTAQTTFANAGERVRCVLSWDSKPNGGPTYSNDALQADLDLWVFQPSGWVAGLSYSSIQPFEVVEFVAPETGHYTLKIRRRTFSGGLEYFGTAMSRDSDI